jgi:hypothetical protein
MKGFFFGSLPFIISLLSSSVWDHQTHSPLYFNQHTVEYNISFANSSKSFGIVSFFDGVDDVEQEFIDYSENYSCENEEFQYFLFGKIKGMKSFSPFSLCGEDNLINTGGYLFLFSHNIHRDLFSFQLLPENNELDYIPNIMSMGLDLSCLSFFVSSHRLFDSKKDIIQGTFLISNQVKYQFSASFFLNQGQYLDGYLDPSLDITSSSRCDDLRSFFVSSSSNSLHEIVFAVVSDRPNRYSIDMLPYWLHYCGLSTPSSSSVKSTLPESSLSVVHIREIIMRSIPENSSSLYWNDNYWYNIDNICNVKDISFFSKNQDLIEDNHYSKNIDLHCIEDFLNLLLYDKQYYYTQSLKEEVSSLIKEQFIFKFPFVLHSSLLLQDKINVFHELLTILRAMVHVRSESKVALFIDQIPFSPTKEVNPFAAAGNPEVQFESFPGTLEVSSYWKSMIQQFDNSPLMVLSDAELYVVIFVSFFHVDIAEEEIQNWKAGCVEGLCHLIVKYLLIPVYSSTDMDLYRAYFNQRKSRFVEEEYCSDPENRRAVVDDYFNAKPLFSSVLLELSRFLVEIYSKNNLIVVLNGLKSIYSFVAPSFDPEVFVGADQEYCSLKNARFFPPHLRYTEVRYFCLSSDIVVSPFLPNAERVDKSFGFVGKTRSLLLLVNHLQEELSMLQQFPPSEHYLEQLFLSLCLKWNEINPLSLSFDNSKKIFNLFTSHDRFAQLFVEGLTGAADQETLVSRIMMNDMRFHSPPSSFSDGSGFSPLTHRVRIDRLLELIPVNRLFDRTLYADLFESVHSRLDDFFIECENNDCLFELKMTSSVCQVSEEEYGVNFFPFFL